MVKCPKCNKEIDFFYAYSENKYTYELNNKGQSIYEEQSQGDYFTSFECPECNEEIFKEEGEAIEFLMDKDDLQIVIEEKIKQIKEKKEDKK